MSIEEIRKFLRERGLEAVPTGVVTGTLADFISWSPENVNAMQFLGGAFPDGVTEIDADGCSATTFKLSDAFTSCLTVNLSNSQITNLTIPATTQSLFLNASGANVPLVCNFPNGLLQIEMVDAAYTQLPALPASLTALAINNCTSLAVPTFPVACTNINAASCDWTAAQVNNALAQLVALGANNGTVDLSGSNAAPTGQGVTDKNTLIARGWTVTTN